MEARGVTVVRFTFATHCFRRLTTGYSVELEVAGVPLRTTRVSAETAARRLEAGARLREDKARTAEIHATRVRAGDLA